MKICKGGQAPPSKTPPCGHSSAAVALPNESARAIMPIPLSRPAEPISEAEALP